MTTRRKVNKRKKCKRKSCKYMREIFTNSCNWLGYSLGVCFKFAVAAIEQSLEISFHHSLCCALQYLSVRVFTNYILLGCGMYIP